MPVISAVHEPL